VNTGLSTPHVFPVRVLYFVSRPTWREAPCSAQSASLSRTHSAGDKGTISRNGREGNRGDNTGRQSAKAAAVTLRDALDSAADLARAEKATATKRAYGSDFAIFRAWCADQGLSALPADPAAVAAFIAAEAGRGVKCSTLGRRIAGIRYGHRLAGLASPTDDERVKAVMRGACRTLGVAPVKKAAATSDKVLAMVAGGKRDLAGKRDRALLLLGFALAARPCEPSGAGRRRARRPVSNP
jgi:hypothetical protein